MINQIFIIHHPSLKERKEYLNSKFKHYNIQNIFWESNIYQQKDFDLLNSSLDFKSTDVSFRHQQCLKNIILNNYEYSLILEDDVILELLNNLDINIFLDKCVKEMKQKNSVLCFNGITDGIGLPSTFDLNDLIYHEPGFTTRCCHSYIVSNVAAKILNTDFNYQKPVDHMYNDVIIKNNIKSYYTKFGFEQGTIVGRYKSVIR